jgi:hypothetical protein
VTVRYTAPDGHLLRVTITDAVLITFDRLRMSKIFLETCTCRGSLCILKKFASYQPLSEVILRCTVRETKKSKFTLVCDSTPRSLIGIVHSIYIYIYIYICVCVCVPDFTASHSTRISFRVHRTENLNFLINIGHLSSHKNNCKQYMSLSI